MDPDRWRRVQELYDSAVEMSPAGRAAFLANACAADIALRQEVESLLAYAAGADSLLNAAVHEVVSQASAAAVGVPEAPSREIRKLGRYQLVEIIGKGGMGEVYRAIDPTIGRTVAIKTILAKESGGVDSPLRSRLVRESQAAGRLSHPNIVAVHDIGEEGTTSYIVMEYIPGRTLAQVMEDDPSLRSNGDALRIVQECAAALDYAHAQGVIHRDVKPANIMLQSDGGVKIADFGIAKISQAAALTQSNLCVGSPHYMAPEQWRGEEVTGKADQYALAAVAYAILAGRPPFEGDSMAALAAMTLYKEPPSAVRFNEKLHPGVDEVLKKALSKNAEARYPTCTAFAIALRDAWDGEPAAPRRRGTSRPMRLATAAVLLAGLGIGGWLLYFREIRGRARPSTKVAQTTMATQPPATQPPTQTVPAVSHPPALSNKPRQTKPDPEPEAEQSMRTGNYTQAVKHFTDAIAASPDYRSYFGRATAYRQLQQDAQAIGDYTKAIALKPDSAIAYHDRALCEGRSGLDTAAAEDYDRVLELDPNNPRSWNSRGVIYLKKGGYNKAKDCFTRAIELDASFIDAYRNRAKSELKLNDAAGAKEDNAKAAELVQQKPRQ